MANRKSTKSKALRNTAARRAAKSKARKRKPIQVCPVKELVLKQMRLIAAHGRVHNQIATAAGNAKERLEKTDDFITDAMLGNREAASHLSAWSREGAAFQLMGLYSDCRNSRNAGDQDRRDEYFRRAERLLYSLRSFFMYQLGVRVHDLGARYYMPNDWNPLWQVSFEANRDT